MKRPSLKTLQGNKDGEAASEETRRRQSASTRLLSGQGLISPHLRRQEMSFYPQSHLLPRGFPGRQANLSLLNLTDGTHGAPGEGAIARAQLWNSSGQPCFLILVRRHFNQLFILPPTFFMVDDKVNGAGSATAKWPEYIYRLN